MISLEGGELSYRIATIPGDGIGREVISEGVRVLKSLAKKSGFGLEFTEFPYSWNIEALFGWVTTTHDFLKAISQE